MDFLFEIAKDRYNEGNKTTFDIFYDELKTKEEERLIDRILNVWNDVIKCFNRLQKAYYDYDAYHLIGYCNTQKRLIYQILSLIIVLKNKYSTIERRSKKKN